MLPESFVQLLTKNPQALAWLAMLTTVGGVAVIFGFLVWLYKFFRTVVQTSIKQAVHRSRRKWQVRVAICVRDKTIYIGQMFRAIAGLFVASLGFTSALVGLLLSQLAAIPQFTEALGLPKGGLIGPTLLSKLFGATGFLFLLVASRHIADIVIVTSAVMKSRVRLLRNRRSRERRHFVRGGTRLWSASAPLGREHSLLNGLARADNTFW